MQPTFLSLLSWHVLSSLPLTMITWKPLVSLSQCWTQQSRAVQDIEYMSAADVAYRSPPCDAVVCIAAGQRCLSAWL